MTLEQKDTAVLNLLQCDSWTAIIDLRSRLRIGTIRGALRRLLAAGKAERRWDGNERFGRFLYRAAR
jgi:hypothetical protein